MDRSKDLLYKAIWSIKRITIVFYEFFLKKKTKKLYYGSYISIIGTLKFVVSL